MRITAFLLLAAAVGFLAGRLSHDPPAVAPGDDLRTDEPAAGADPRTQLLASDDATGDVEIGEASADAPAAATDAGSRGPVLQGAADAGAFVTKLRAAYRQASGGQAIPRDLLRHYEAQYRGMLAAQPAGFARMAWEHEQLRRRVGVLGDPAVVLLQAHSTRRIEVAMASERPPRHMQTDELPMTPGPVKQDAVHARGGLVPFDHVFVVEQVVSSGSLSATRRAGEVRLDVGQGEVRLPAGASFETTHTGRAWIHPGREHDVRLRVEGHGRVQCRLVGRLVSRAEIGGLRVAPFELTAFQGEGFLTGEPVLLQVRADHGGGNPRTIYLDGTTNGRVDAMADAEIWDERLDPAAIGDSRGFARGAGLVPPGKWFEITSITWRGRLRAKSGHSDLQISARGKRLVGVDANEDVAPRGTWTGSVIVRPGQERSVSLTAHYFGLVEATIHGRLIEPTTAPR